MPIINDTTSRGYQLPNKDNKLKDDVPRIRAAVSAIDADIVALLLSVGQRAMSQHSHAFSDVPGLTEALAAKAAANHVHALDDLADVDSAGAANGQVLIRQGAQWIPINLAIANIANLGLTLDSKADSLATSDALAARAPIDAPTFTGAPKAPTPSTADNSTRLATTAYARLLLAARAVLFDGPQTLNDTQKAQARANIGLDASLAGLRSPVINGNFDVWQRGTIFSATSIGADMWYTVGTPDTFVNSRQAHVVGQTDVPGNPKYFDRTVVNSAPGAANQVFKEIKIEGVQTFAGELVTLTFYARANAAKNIALAVAQYFGDGGAPSATVFTPLGLKALGTGFVKVQIVFTVPSIAGKVIGNGRDYLSVLLYYDAGSNYNANASNLGQQSGTFDLSRLSLVKGDATAEADPCPNLSPQQVLSLCQRYCETGFFAIEYNYNGNMVQTIGFRVTKRDIPSVNFVNVANPGSGVQTVLQASVDGFAVKNAAGSTSIYWNANWMAVAPL